jgi:hypothetical protein
VKSCTPAFYVAGLRLDEGLKTESPVCIAAIGAGQNQKGCKNFCHSYYPPTSCTRSLTFYFHAPALMRT